MSRSMGSRIRIRIKRPWRGYPVGAVINPPGGLRQLLVGDGIAEIMDKEVPAVEAPAAASIQDDANASQGDVKMTAPMTDVASKKVEPKKVGKHKQHAEDGDE